MAGSIPESIPAEYASPESVADAYRAGWNHGHGIACHNVPRIGETYWTEGHGRTTCDAENVKEVHSLLCHDTADNARSYSPFEFTAAEFNANGEGGWFVVTDDDMGGDTLGPFDTREEAESEADEGDTIEERPSSSELWEAFEAGTADAIAADLTEYTPENYGIEEAEED